MLGEGDIVFCDRCQSKKKKMRTVMDVVNRIWVGHFLKLSFFLMTFPFNNNKLMSKTMFSLPVKGQVHHFN